MCFTSVGKSRVPSRVFSVSELLCAWVLMVSLSAQAESKELSSPDEPGQLLELYTSQGCSSCPPAERWISHFKHDKRLWKSLFPLAFHVDYWDYIGWKDELAKPEYGARQRQYRRLGFLNQVATPGFVVSGKGWNGWYRGERLTNAQDIPGLGKLNLTILDRKVDINYLTNQIDSHAASYRINIALLGFDIRSSIDAGENRGRQLKQDFVVLSLQREFLLNEKSVHDGKEQWRSRLHLPKTSSEHSSQQALVAWVSQGNDPRPLQIAGGWL